MIPDPSPPFELGMSDTLRSHILRLSRKAAGIGIAADFREKVREILESLRQDPRGSGDPVRKLHGFSMTEYRIVRDQLICSYSVHDRIPMVTVWRFEPGPGHPLYSTPLNGN